MSSSPACFDNSCYFAATAIIDPFGIVFNVLCVICFVQILWRPNRSDPTSSGSVAITCPRSNMFKYLIIKAMCDLFVFVNNIFNLIIYCTNNSVCTFITYTYAYQWWYVYIQNDVNQILLFISAMMEVAATIDCYLGITKKLEFVLTKISFYVTSAGIFMFSLGGYSYMFPAFYVELFTKTIQVPVTVGNSSTSVTQNYSYFYFGYTDFSQSYAEFVWALAIGFFRDFGITCVLIILNILILNQLRSATKRRMELAGGGEDAAMDRTVVAIMQAERKKSIMIVFTGFNYIVGHLGRPVFMVILEFYNAYMNLPGMWCFAFLVDEIIYVAYATPFLFYYFFNTHFKKVVDRILFFPFMALFGSGEKETVSYRRTVTTTRTGDNATARQSSLHLRKS